VITPQSVLEDCDLVGHAGARDGSSADAIDGVLPQVVVEPASPEALAALLAWASRTRLAVVLRGSGTKLGWGRTPSAIDLVIGTRRLNRVLAHQHGDLTAIVEGGTTIVELNRELSRHGQWLPVDVPFGEATIGGTLAAGDSGPLRHRHGTPRDLLIGVHLATTDGRIVKSGGNVVKNVAGYDLGKLMSGSFGALAAIVSATFKLAPLPPETATLLASFGTAAALGRAVAAVSASQIEPCAFDVQLFVPPAPGRSGAGHRPASYQLLMQFASTSEAIRAQTDEARRLMAADEERLVTGPEEAGAWSRHRDLVWAAPGTIIKLSWLPASLPSVLSVLEDVDSMEGRAVALLSRAGVGVGFLGIDADAAATVRVVERLRASPSVGHVVVLRADASVKERIDVWGAPADSAALVAEVKRAFDPAGILNARRGPI
jgi:glycolate oxidase FAD binding subunit